MQCFLPLKTDEISFKERRMKDLLQTGLIASLMLLGTFLISVTVLSTDAFAQTTQTAKEAFDAKEWEKAAKLARHEALDGNANSQGLLAQLYHFGQGLPKDGSLAVMWYTISMANGNMSIEGLSNGASFHFNDAELVEIRNRATACLKSNYSNCD